MESIKFDRVEAVHPNWKGFLRLSSIDNSVIHEVHSSQGTYDLSNGTLTVFWDEYEPDVFVECSGLYFHEDLLRDAPKIERLLAVNINNKPIITTRISVLVPNNDYEVSLRINTSDVPTFDQIFVANEYESPNLPKSASTIVDLGANIGLAAVFFGMKYREARILSVEPEDFNFAAMVANIAALGDRVQSQHAAVWVRDGFINLHTESEAGSPLDAWGVQISDHKSRSNKMIACYKLGTLLDKAGFDSVDILKVDIEGAELEVFSHGVAEWLPRIKLIIVETHDRFRPGSDEAVRNAILPNFEELPQSGENLFFRRKNI